MYFLFSEELHWFVNCVVHQIRSHSHRCLTRKCSWTSCSQMLTWWRSGSTYGAFVNVLCGEGFMATLTMAESELGCLLYFSPWGMKPLLPAHFQLAKSKLAHLDTCGSVGVWHSSSTYSNVGHSRHPIGSIHSIGTNSGGSSSHCSTVCVFSPTPQKYKQLRTIERW